MVSDAVRRQVEDIQGQWTKRLEELSIIVLLLLIPIFVDVWFSDFIHERYPIPHHLGYLYNNVIQLIAGLVFLMYIVWYFWQVRNKPEFHVLFIEHKEDIEHIIERKQIDTKRFFWLFLIPVGVSIGLASITAPFATPYLSVDLSPEQTLWWNFEHNPLLYCPLIVVVCSSIVLYYAYRIKPERVQGSAPWLLFIPLILSLFFEFSATSAEISAWLFLMPWWGGHAGELPSPGSIAFTNDISIFGYRALFITSLILLLYLTYRASDEHRKASTLVKEKHLRGFIEKGVWILPKRVRMGDSYHISLDLTLSKDFVSADHLCIKNRCFKKDEYRQLENIRVPSSDYLEAEIQAVGLKVDGEKRLRICKTSPLSITGWSCLFPNSGTHIMNLMINVVRRDNSRRIVFAQNHAVKVESLLQGSWAPVLALMAPILATVLDFLLKTGR